jgi:hypothetical protein
MCIFLITWDTCFFNKISFKFIPTIKKTCNFHMLKNMNVHQK